MQKQRKSYAAELNAKVALEALKGHRTVNEIALHYGVHPNQVAQWKKQVLEGASEIFSDQHSRAARDEEALKAELYQQIGHLKVELDWLTKKVGLLG